MQHVSDASSHQVATLGRVSVEEIRTKGVVRREELHVIDLNKNSSRCDDVGHLGIGVDFEMDIRPPAAYKFLMTEHMEHLPSTRMVASAIGARAIGAQAIGAQAIKAQGIGGLAIGALAVGAVAIGTLALGRLIIGRLAIRRTRLGVVEIDDLRVGRLRVRELMVDDRR
jgi:hypothetical protein